MGAFVPHNSMVSCLTNACIRINQMHAFDPIKCMQLYVTNAEVRVQKNRQAALALFGELDAAYLKPVFGKLHGQISCDELRLLRLRCLAR
ncbi:hypothetical protein GCAAIG_10685 [Candidatus Electronema halotolerans]